MNLTLNEIANIIDQGTKQGYTANWFIRAFEPIQRRLEKLDNDDTGLSLTDVFVSNDKKRRKMEKEYEKAYGTVIGGMRSHAKSLYGSTGGGGNSGHGNKNLRNRINTKQIRDDFRFMELALKRTGLLMDSTVYKKKDGNPLNNPSVVNNTTNITNNSKSNADKPVTEFRKNALNVNLVGVDDKIMEKLSRMGFNGNVNTVIDNSGGEKKKKEGGGFWSKLLGGLFGLGAGLIGGYALLKGFETDGRLKGTLKLIGKASMDYFLKFVGNIGKGVVSFFGHIDSLLTTYARKMANQGSMTASKIAKKINPVRGLKNLIVGGLKKIMGKQFFPLMRAMKSGGKIGGKTAGKFAVKKIPFGLGALVSFFFAYQRFKSGDIFGGILEIASGVASIFPVVGTGIAIAIDLFLAGRDLFTSRDERRNPNVDGVNTSQVWGNMNKFMKEKTAWIKNIPIVGGLLAIHESYKAFKRGDTKDGLIRLLSGIAPFGNEWVYNAIGGLEFLNRNNKGYYDDKISKKSQQIINIEKEINSGLLRDTTKSAKLTKAKDKLKKLIDEKRQLEEARDGILASALDGGIDVGKAIDATKPSDVKQKNMSRRLKNLSDRDGNETKEILVEIRDETVKTRKAIEDADQNNQEGLSKTASASLIAGSTTGGSNGSTNINVVNSNQSNAHNVSVDRGRFLESESQYA